MYADVIVDVTQASMSHTYTYRIPPDLAGQVKVGSCVRVPFGKGGRTTLGYVVEMEAAPKAGVSDVRIKDIESVCDDKTSIEDTMIRLALWMKQTYGSSLNNALKAILPVRDKEKEPKKEKICLAVSPERAAALRDEYQKKHYSAKERLLSRLLENGSLDKSTASADLKITGSTLKSLERDGVIRLEEYTSWRMPEDLKEDLHASAVGPQMTEEQETAYQGILGEWKGQDRPSLLYGVTGSGKTLVYIELIRRVLEEGRQAIVLIPEISLSWQTVRRFRRQFGDEVTVLNSRMSKGERSDQYERARRGEVRIVIGPRSALFTPFSNPGLIIVDEEQEPSYRNEKAPRYDAREAAVMRGQLDHAHVVFGSATPSVDTWYRCQKGDFALFRMNSRYGGAQLPQVYVADMRKELRSGNRSVISRILEEKIRDRLKRKEQVMLFLNRRGYSGFVSCRSCGEPVKCPHCDVSLTYHRNGRLVCHYCGYETGPVTKCPSCGSPFISGYRAGTEKVESEIAGLFPEAKIVRMDADTTRQKNAYENILKTFALHEADILIGTQMIVKGHDFPGVTLVGILAADLSLYASDYRAPERTYQLLVQAIGRAGRGDRPGEAVIQTYSPEHYSIQDAVKQDYDAFYEEEITGREMMNYPPASNMLAIHGSGQNEEKLSVAMTALKKFLIRFEGSDTVLVGPAPESISRIMDAYRQVLYVKEKDRQRLEYIRSMTEKYIEINSGFRGMFFQYDLNA